MNFKMTKTELSKYAALSTELRSKLDSLTDATEEFNDGVAALIAPVFEAREEAQQAATDLREFIDQFHSDQQSDYSDKSERWQEGDKGSAVAQWLDEWELFGTSLEIPEIEAREPLAVEVEFDLDDSPAESAGE